ncbi:MAG: hypothetical protein RLZZ618_397 [Pseudomonadota bacterium]|jgi:outer membrane protein OmpA-like peptidoglycan-associated protein
MSDTNDGTEKPAFILLTVLVTAVVAGVIGLGVAKSHRAAPPNPLGAQAEMPQPVDRVRFDPGQDSIPIDGQPALNKMAQSARSTDGAVIVISGGFNAGRDAAAHQALAVRRLAQIRHALEANGVAPSQLIMAAPSPLPPNSDPRLFDQIDMRLQ